MIARSDAATPLLDIAALNVVYNRQGLHAIANMSLHIHRGEVVALVGESGSGKSTVAQAILGLINRKHARIDGSIHFAGRNLLLLSDEERRQIRGKSIAIVPQDPFTTLNPSLTVAEQVAEPLIYHLNYTRQQAYKRVLSALGEVQLRNPERVAASYPHQLSGGMQQRVLIATALICDPELLVLDEPTTALDVTVECQILELLEAIKTRRGLAMMYITHNLQVVRRIADRVCVLYAGQIVELGARDPTLELPAHPYTKGLLAASPQLGGIHHRLAPIPGGLPDRTKEIVGCIFRPRCVFAEPSCEQPQHLREEVPARAVRCWKAAALLNTPWRSPTDAQLILRQMPARADPLIASRNLVKTFVSDGQRWWMRLLRRAEKMPAETRALDDVSLDIRFGEVLGLVGESGSGKSTLGRALNRLIDVDNGRIIFEGQDLTHAPERALTTYRAKAQIVFQNPDSSLNPRRVIGKAIERVLALHSKLGGNERRHRVEELLKQVGLSPAFYERFPFELSGGEKQRVGIARALATKPDFVVFDEPVSALDVSVQATIINLLEDLRQQLQFSALFISHDIAVVAYVADRIAVLQSGQLCEVGSRDAILAPPYHPYTHVLLSAAFSRSHNTQVRPSSSHGPNAKNRGCAFQDRCPFKLGAICEEERPAPRGISNNHLIWCHLPVALLPKDMAAV